MNRVELLIPARNLISGKLAIDHGADAVYMGAPSFGARQAAGNSLEDLEEMARYAHLYGSKVFVTVNTLLYDPELEGARRMIWQLYEMGIDALIVQDLGLLKMDLPPMALHASTQCHNVSLERIQFLEKLGFKRAILAREMNLETIRAIRKQTEIELETFIHGALCVSYSGQCYMSRMITGRSGNRGECAQLCRTCFDLEDANGKTIVHQKHLLSLRDMNRSASLSDLLEAGVVSFKVEGRLKDDHYVRNITAFYRRQLDALLDGKKYVRAGSGTTEFFFQPDPDKSFNRGFTEYFIRGEREKIASFDTPKAMGHLIGKLRQDEAGRIHYIGTEQISRQDGLCFLNHQGELEGFLVNKMEGDRLIPHKPVSKFRQVDVYRNVDKAFEKILSGKTARRAIEVDMCLEAMEGGFRLVLRDEDGCEAESSVAMAATPALKPDTADQQVAVALAKLGGTPFTLRNLQQECKGFFFQSSVLNKLRSEAVEALIQNRLRHFYPKDVVRHNYIPEHLWDSADYKRNITNVMHKALYADFGATEIEYGLDSTLDFKGKEVMVCKYCLRYELGKCPKYHGAIPESKGWYLRSGKYRFRLVFDCKRCEMKVIAE